MVHNMKRYFITSILILFTSILVLGQQAQQLPPIEDKPNHNGWMNDAQKAAKLAQETKAPVLLFFTGSDWCGWCHKLYREVLGTPEFATWVKENNIILLEIDFPRGTPQSDALKIQNQSLQQQFQVRGYPTIYIVSQQGTAQMGYVAGGPKAWIAQAESKMK